jgi:hypothetical protein
MKLRAALAGTLALCGLFLGLWTAWVSASNHALARDLDRRMRACDALEVWNENLELKVLATEERMLAEQGAAPTVASPAEASQ